METIASIKGQTPMGQGEVCLTSSYIHQAVVSGERQLYVSLPLRAVTSISYGVRTPKGAAVVAVLSLLLTLVFLLIGLQGGSISAVFYVLAYISALVALVAFIAWVFGRRQTLQVASPTGRIILRIRGRADDSVKQFVSKLEEQGARVAD